MEVLEYKKDPVTREISFRAILTEQEMSGFDIQNVTPEKVQRGFLNLIEPDRIIFNVFNGYELTGMMEPYLDREKSGRVAKAVELRRACMFFLRKYTTMTLEAIGEKMNVGHDTALFHIRKYNNFIKHDRETERIYDKIVANIKKEIDND